LFVLTKKEKGGADKKKAAGEQKITKKTLQGAKYLTKKGQRRNGVLFDSRAV